MNGRGKKERQRLLLPVTASANCCTESTRAEREKKKKTQTEQKPANRITKTFADNQEAPTVRADPVNRAPSLSPQSPSKGGKKRRRLAVCGPRPSLQHPPKAAHPSAAGAASRRRSPEVAPIRIHQTLRLPPFCCSLQHPVAKHRPVNSLQAQVRTGTYLSPNPAHQPQSSPSPSPSPFSHLTAPTHACGCHRTTPLQVGIGALLVVVPVVVVVVARPFVPARHTSTGCCCFCFCFCFPRLRRACTLPTLPLPARLPPATYETLSSLLFCLLATPLRERKEKKKREDTHLHKSSQTPRFFPASCSRSPITITSPSVEHWKQPGSTGTLPAASPASTSPPPPPRQLAGNTTRTPSAPSIGPHCTAPYHASPWEHYLGCFASELLGTARPLFPLLTRDKARNSSIKRPCSPRPRPAAHCHCAHRPSPSETDQLKLVPSPGRPSWQSIIHFPPCLLSSSSITSRTSSSTTPKSPTSINHRLSSLPTNSSTTSLSARSRPRFPSPRATLLRISRGAPDQGPGLSASSPTNPTRALEAATRSTFTKHPKRRKQRDYIPRQILPSL